MNLFADGNNMVYSDYYGGGADKPPMYAVRRIARLMERYRITNVVIAWDSPRSFRHDLFSSYKSGRTKPEDIDEVIAETQSKLAEDGYRNVTADHFEADDILATLAVKGLAADQKSILYSSDKDIHQLLYRGKISQLLRYRSVLGSSSGQGEWVTHDGEHGLIEKYGVDPLQWVDYRSLTGDSSDSIPGVPGIGPKAAKEILTKWGMVDAYYQDPGAHELKPSIHRKMEAGREQLPLLRELITLRTDVEIVDLKLKNYSETAPW